MTRRAAAAAAIALAAAAPIFAGGAKPSARLALTPSFGAKFGEVGEYVYYNESEYGDDTLSRLDWEADPAVFAGIEADGGVGAFFGKISFSAALPTAYGEMRDSDWQNVAAQGAAGHQYKTNYSESPNSLEYDVSLGVRAGMEIAFGGALRPYARPFAEFGFSTFKFNAKGGKYWYGSRLQGKGSPVYAEWDDAANRTEGELSGKVISYKRNTFSAWLGVEGGITLPNEITLSAEVAVSPYIFAESIDTHWLKNAMFADQTGGAFRAFSGGLALSKRLSERVEIALRARAFRFLETRGKSYNKTVAAKSYKHDEYNDGGASEWSASLSLGVRLTVL